ncbi:hypothetical protein ETAA8_42010 [Anatilimnocola aggregata]|uniref:Uncharacterized protein n=1 Tax=Anatilimnocola aggregata TaxID=2528021 RepID=A0A517YFU6_9BACT|nr:hypothetical protein ETAA8_42010 [Anatilimnocola aggregata]
MELAAIILSLTAIGGLVVAALRICGLPYPPMWLALGHGGAAVTGLAVLAYSASTQDPPWLVLVALAMFVCTAFGGIALFTLFHLRSVALPIPLVLGHGALAIASLVTLLIAVFG